jgi:signal transduction histidine kinase
MTTCLNDILDVTRMETGRLSIAPSAQPVPALVQRVAAGFVNRAKAAGVEIEQHIAADLPDAAIDPHRIAQVISNLVDNSLKFTASGGKVVVDVAQSAGTPNTIRVSVSDTGKGIAPEHLANIFERLYQVRDGTEQSRMGLGLGLFICREIVRLHGGELSVTSEVGKGTTFTFDLPVASVQPTPPSEGIHSHG